MEGSRCLVFFHWCVSLIGRGVRIFLYLYCAVLVKDTLAVMFFSAVNGRGCVFSTPFTMALNDSGRDTFS